MYNFNLLHLKSPLRSHPTRLPRYMDGSEDPFLFWEDYLTVGGVNLGICRLRRAFHWRGQGFALQNMIVQGTVKLSLQETCSVAQHLLAFRAARQVLLKASVHQTHSVAQYFVMLFARRIVGLIIMYTEVAARR